jgi:hypothetical protein
MSTGLNIPSTGALDFLSLGALVHRLDPGIIPFRKATECKIHVSGGEFNTAAGLNVALVNYPLCPTVSLTELVEAARAGHVAIANALGSGLIESPAFLAFLPSLCSRLLGEKLKIPNVATWWCGQATEQHYVIEHLHEIVVKPAFATHVRKSVFGGRISRKERDDLVAAIRARRAPAGDS